MLTFLSRARITSIMKRRGMVNSFFHRRGRREDWVQYPLNHSSSSCLMVSTELTLRGRREDWVQYPSNHSSSSCLKGQCHEIFDFWFFSWISFPQAPEYTIRVVSNFLENSRRYSQLKVCHRCQRHRWQMQKIFNHKSFNYLVWTPWGSKVSL